MSLTIGVVIPCYKPHIGVLKRLLDSIEAQSRKPDMVVVSCSSSQEEDMPYKSSDYSYPLKIFTHSEKRNTAQNKNYGSRIVGTDIISYFDADDIMHPQRIEVIFNVFMKNSNLKLLLHSLKLNPPDFNYPTYEVENIPVELDPFFICHWGAVNLKHESYRAIHNGHNAIRKDIFNEVQYIESDDGLGREDTIFNRVLIQKYQNSQCIGYCPYELTWYFPSSTGGYR